MKFNPSTFLAITFAAILLLLQGAVSQSEPSLSPDTPEATLSRIRTHIEALLSKPQPDLFARHFRSVLALSEEDVLKLELAGSEKDARAKELYGYLSTIEAGLNGDGERAEPYLVDGKRSLTLARLSQSDGALQFYTLSLPPHCNGNDNTKTLEEDRRPCSLSRLFTLPQCREEMLKRNAIGSERKRSSLGQYLMVVIDVAESGLTRERRR